MFEVFTQEMRLPLDELVAHIDGIKPGWRAEPATLEALCQCIRETVAAMGTEKSPEGIKALKVIYEGLQAMVHVMERIG